MSQHSKAISDAMKYLNQVAGEEITYYRGSDFVKLRAVEGRSQFQSVDPNGAVVDFSTTDFLIASSDLVLNDVVTTPVDGDYIMKDTATYRIRRQGSAQAYSYSDAAHERMRIHTQYGGV